MKTKNFKTDLLFSDKSYPKMIELIREAHKEEIVLDVRKATLEEDRELGIDCYITTIEGTTSYQLKSNRVEYLKRKPKLDNVIFEFYQNIETQEKGQWFYGKEQYYLHCFFDEKKDKIIKKIIFDMEKFKI